MLNEDRMESFMVGVLDCNSSHTGATSARFIFGVT